MFGGLLSSVVVVQDAKHINDNNIKMDLAFMFTDYNFDYTLKSNLQLYWYELY